jgi:hypothetical protein
MNLKRAMFWKRPASVDTQQAAMSESPTKSAGGVESQKVPADQGSVSSAKVIPLPSSDATMSPAWLAGPRRFHRGTSPTGPDPGPDECA